MNRMQGVVVAVFIVAALSFVGTIYFFTQIEGERQARISAEKGQAELTLQIQEKDKQLEEKSQSLATLEQQMDELKAEVRTKNQEITKNRTTIAQSESSIKDSNEKNQLLQKENKDLKARLDYFEKQYGVSGAQTEVVDGAVIESNGVSNPSNSKATSGKVILVNREYNFIVAGIGKLDGLNMKDQMEIIRGDQVIGKVAVSKLYDSLSSCEIVQEGKSQIQEGDLVRSAIKA